MMNRRDALARVALLMGGAVIGADYFLTSCSPSSSDKGKAQSEDGASASNFKALDAKQQAYLDEVGETILPTKKYCMPAVPAWAKMRLKSMLPLPTSVKLRAAVLSMSFTCHSGKRPGCF